jgi:hypothetical protein
MRIAVCRRSAGIVVRISPRLVGTNAAAPAACTQRSATISHRLLLTAQPRLASENSSSPTMKPPLFP